MFRKKLLIGWANNARRVRQRSIGLLGVLLAVLMLLAACAENPEGAQETEPAQEFEELESPGPVVEEEDVAPDVEEEDLASPEAEALSPSPGAEASPSPMVDTSPSPTTEAASPSPEAAGEGNMVEVALTEFEIKMPSTLPAGPTTFEVTNTGTVPHNFEVEGQGIEKEFDSNLQAGETKTMQVDLQPGTYEVYCPVANHEELGMQLELTVNQQ